MPEFMPGNIPVNRPDISGGKAFDTFKTLEALEEYLDNFHSTP